MLDGRIDLQGTLSDLKSAGKLDYIIHDQATEKEEMDEKKEEKDIAEGEAVETAVTEGDPATDPKKAKKPRKLVEDEARAEGSVKWSVYRTYLQASYVPFFSLQFCWHNEYRSYWTWGILLCLIICVQGLGVGEKLWIKVWGEVRHYVIQTFYSFDADNDLT